MNDSAPVRVELVPGGNPLPVKETEAWPVHTSTYSAVVAIQGQAGVIVPLVDGCRRPEFRPRSAIVRVSPPAATPSTVGAAVIEVTGLGGNTTYVRTFSLGIGSSIELDLQSFEDVRILVLGGTVGAHVNAAISERYAQNVPDRSAYFAEAFTAAGVRLVPPGAAFVMALAADAGFTWRTFIGTGGAVSIAPGIAAGARVPVMGTHIVTVVAVQQLLWEIEL